MFSFQFQNIYTANELDSSNVVDKMAKIEFLQKLIKILNDDGLLKNVKAAKIVAGKEPEQTNLVYLLLEWFCNY